MMDINFQDYDRKKYYISDLNYVPGSLVWVRDERKNFSWPAMVDKHPQILDFFNSSTNQ